MHINGLQTSYYIHIYVIYAYNVVVVMPNSYSRQQTKMFVDRGCEVFKAGKREKELEREKAMHEMGTKWGQDVLRSGRFKHFVMFWHRMISNAAGAVRRQERLQKEQAKTGDANQNKPTHMDHHGSTCHLVSLRVPCHLQESLLKKVEDKLPHKHQKLQPINHGFALNHFVARHTGSDDVSSYDLAFTMPPTVSNQ